MEKSIQIAIRVEQASVDLADELVELIAKASPVPTTRAAVLRRALERGLDAMRAELTPPTRRRK